MTPDPVSPDLKSVLKRLRLGRMIDTLPERLVLARQQKMPHADFLLLALSDEVSRRDGQATVTRAQRARLDPALQLEAWDPTAQVTYDRALLNELVSLRFLEVTPTSRSSVTSAWARRSSRTRSATSPAVAVPRCSPCAPTRCSRPSSTHGWIAPTRPSCAS